MLPANFIGIYEKLLDRLNSDKSSRIWGKDGRVCAFAALTGNNWRPQHGVAFYGRAQNQWIEQSGFGRMDIASPEARREKAKTICDAGHTASICELCEKQLVWDEAPGGSRQPCDDRQMHWVNHPRDRSGYHCRSVAVGTAFWNVVGQVVKKRYDEAGETNWASWAAWSNLYKVAPAKGGNPGSRLMSLQLDICKELLKAELFMWQPRAAVFLTETNKRSGDFSKINDEWFGQFRDALKIDCLHPLPKTSLKGETPLVHVGDANVVGPQSIRIVVALRPENINHEELSHKIVEGLRLTSC